MARRPTKTAHQHPQHMQDSAQEASPRAKKVSKSAESDAVPEGYKRCSKCEEVKGRRGFYRRARSRDGLTSVCIRCSRAAVDAYQTRLRLRTVFPERATKACRDCGEVKDISAFSIARREKDGRNPRCRGCDGAACRRLASLNAGREAATQKKCGGCLRVRKAKHFTRLSSAGDGLNRHCKTCVRAKTYKTTWQELEQLWQNQGGRCAACSRDIGYDYVVDHCHTTQRVRALLCNGCNLSFGNTDESPAKALSLARYAIRQQRVSLRLRRQEVAQKLLQNMSSSSLSPVAHPKVP
jgi:hypothetical protein